MAKNFDKDLINQGKELNKEIKDNPFQVLKQLNLD